MKTAVILHGMPSKEEYFDSTSPAQSNKHWLPWIQRQLILNGILAQTIELPEPYTPDYEKWRSVFEQFHTDEETTLIGHSCGGGFLARWLSENKMKVGKVALVAPWLDPERESTTNFFDFKIDRGVPERTKGLAIFVSNDEKNVLDSVETLKKEWAGVKIIEVSNKQHFTFGGMGTQEFRELREFLIG